MDISKDITLIKGSMIDGILIEVQDLLLHVVGELDFCGAIFNARRKALK